jgi:hypothetical protein
VYVYYIVHKSARAPIPFLLESGCPGTAVRGRVRAVRVSVGGIIGRERGWCDGNISERRATAM